MFLSKGFAIYGVLALVLGLLTGTLALSQNFALLKQYRVEADLGYAYFKILEVSENASSSLRETLISYIFILNITNPTSEVIKTSGVYIGLAEKVSRIGEQEAGISMENGIISFYRSFSHYWYPNRTKLIAITGVVAVPSMGLMALQQGNCSVVFEVEGRAQEGARASSGYIIKQVQLSILNSQEYVYKGIFTNQRFRLREDGPNVIIETGG